MEKNIRATGSPNDFAVDLLVAETLGLKIEILNGIPLSRPFIYEIAKDSELKWTAVFDIPKDTRFIKNGVYASLAYHSITCKHPFLASFSIYRNTVSFWCKVRYYVFNKRPDLDWKFIACSIFPGLHRDDYAKVISGITERDTEYARNIIAVYRDSNFPVSVMVSFAIKRCKIICHNIIDYFFKVFGVHRSSPVVKSQRQ